MAINLNDVDVTNLEQIVTLLNQLNTDLSSKLNTAENNVNNINSNISALQLAVSGIQSGIKIKLLGTDSTFDLKTNYELYGLHQNDYQNLTVDDFIIDITSGATNSIGCGIIDRAFLTVGTEFVLNKTYDNTTGILTINPISRGTGTMTSTYSIEATIPHKVYIKYGV